MIRQIRQWFGALFCRQHHRRPPKVGKQWVRLQAELLEDRLAPATYIVTGLADGTGTVTPTGNGFFHASTLRAAITAVNTSTTGANNTIDLAVRGTYPINLVGTPGETDNAAGEFAIIPNGTNGSSLTIQNTSGGAVTVNGNELNRVFDINPGNTPTVPKFNVTMTGFTITNGLASPGDGAPGSGGGIRDQNNVSLTLTKMTLSNNIATADGGGVSMENVVSAPWTLTLNNTIVTGNHAGDAGGGVETDGSGKVFVNGGTISNNTTVNQGAGIWLDAILASNGTVGSATVTAGGTGYTAPTVTINDPTGTGATAFAQFVNGQIIGVTITNVGTGYTAPTITITDPTGSGAAVTANLNVLQSANLTVSGALITNNKALSATSGVGGGIGNAGTGEVTIVNSTISRNTAGGVGGGFADQNSMGTLVVLNSFFQNNVAAGNGGAIAEGGPQTNITYSQIQGNASGGFGGGIFATGLTLFVYSSTIANNVSVNNGAGLEVATIGPGLAVSTIQDTTITSNVADNNVTGPGGIANGGGIDAEETGDLALQNDTINANFASNGGGLFWPGVDGVLAVQNAIIAANAISNDGTGPDVANPAGTITDGGGNLIGVSGAGGGNTGFTAPTTQTGTVASPLNPFLGPLANNGGPTVGAPGQSLVLPTEALLLGSPAFGKGTLFRAQPTDERGLPSVINGKINVGAVSNGPTVAPPGIVSRVISPLVSVSGTTTTFNVNTTADILTPPTGTLTLRAAIQQANTTAGNVIINLRVAGTYQIALVGTPGETDNAAGEFAIYQGGGTNPTSLIIQNVSGGAVTVDGNHLNRVFDINPNDVVTAPKFSVTMTGFTITNGVASPGDAAGGSGGGIRDHGNVSLTLTKMTLSNNLATADGGGVSMENGASTPWTLTLNNTIVTGNHAGDAGGGVETDGSGNVFVTGGTISNNTSVNQGAGIWLDGILTISAPQVANFGNGYTVGDVLTVQGGTFTMQAQLTVTAVGAGGVITAAVITQVGSYSVPPSNPVSALGGTGDQTATFNLTFGLASANLTVTGTLVSGNFALSAGGNDGGIGNAGNGAVSLVQDTIQNNFAAATCGGVGDDNSLGTFSMRNTLILNNTAVGNGGGLNEGGSTVNITNSQIQGNNTGSLGGGLSAGGTASTLTVLNVTFAANVSANSGGAIELTNSNTTSTFTFTNTTIAGNLADNNATGFGGGIDAEEMSGTVTLLNDTINGNFASGDGSGIFWTGNGTFGVQNTIIAANLIGLNAGSTANSVGPDAFDLLLGTNNFTDNGGNLIGVGGAGSGNNFPGTGSTQAGTVANPLNPLLGPLTNNGGPIVGAPGSSITLQTEGLLKGSKAIDMGVAAGAPSTDERGRVRPDAPGERPDIGAFELQGTPPSDNS